MKFFFTGQLTTPDHTPWAPFSTPKQCDLPRESYTCFFFFHLVGARGMTKCGVPSVGRQLRVVRLLVLLARANSR